MTDKQVCRREYFLISFSLTDGSSFSFSNIQFSSAWKSRGPWYFRGSCPGLSSFRLKDQNVEKSEAKIFTSETFLESQHALLIHSNAAQAAVTALLIINISIGQLPQLKGTWLELRTLFHSHVSF